MNIYIYSNCQGEAIKVILKKLYPTSIITYQSNYNTIISKIPININLINTYDVFLYQPINKNKGEYSTDYILSKLKHNIVKISFPYIYNTGMWNIVINNNNLINGFNNSYTNFNENSRINGIDCLIKYKNLNDLYNDFINEKLFFNLKKRFFDSINKLKDIEKKTDIKISNFIEKNYKIIPMFYRDCHPSLETLKEVTKRILILLKLDFDNNILNNITNLQEFNMLTNGYIPITPYEIKELDLQWNIVEYFKQENKKWKDYYLSIFKNLNINYS